MTITAVQKLETRVLEQSTNAFGTNGQLFSVPRFLLKYKDSKYTYGDSRIQDPRHMIEWLVMQSEVKTLGDVRQHCNETNPYMVVTLNGTDSFIIVEYNESYESMKAKFQDLYNVNPKLVTKSLIKKDASIYHKEHKYGNVLESLTDNNKVLCKFYTENVEVDLEELEVINA